MTENGKQNVVLAVVAVVACFTASLVVNGINWQTGMTESEPVLVTSDAAFSNRVFDVEFSNRVSEMRAEMKERLEETKWWSEQASKSFSQGLSLGGECFKLGGTADDIEYLGKAHRDGRPDLIWKWFSDRAMILR